MQSQHPLLQDSYTYLQNYCALFQKEVTQSPKTLYLQKVLTAFDIVITASSLLTQDRRNFLVHRFYPRQGKNLHTEITQFLKANFELERYCKQAKDNVGKASPESALSEKMNILAAATKAIAGNILWQHELRELQMFSSEYEKIYQECKETRQKFANTQLSLQTKLEMLSQIFQDMAKMILWNHEECKLDILRKNLKEIKQKPAAL